MNSGVNDMNTRRLSLVALVIAAGLGLAGCAAAGGASPAPAATQGAPDAGNGFGRNGGGFGGAAGAFPGASGLVAAVDGSTAQVQSTTRQTAVTWTPSTRFTTQVAAASGDLKTGECVIARPARTAGTNSQGGTGSGSTGGTGSTTVAAATVVMFASVDGTCTAGFGGARGARPNTAPTPAPGNGGGNGGNGQGRPGGGFGGFGFAATGAVKSISTGSFIVTETRGGTTRDETVTFDSTTTFAMQKAGTASDVVVGVCVLAQGKTDDTGALTATTIAVSPAVDGTCVTGLGGRGGFGGPTPNPGSSGASA
jgi:hypothetical protein